MMASWVTVRNRMILFLQPNVPLFQNSNIPSFHVGGINPVPLKAA
jgi:hypothetical protein